MNRNAFRLVIFIGTIAIVGVVAVQVYFIQHAFSQQDRQLNQTLRILLRDVAEQIAIYNDSDPPHEDPVIRMSSDYYIVNANGLIEPEILEHFLTQEFRDHGLRIDFEYGIYDCQSDEMVFGRLFRFGEKSRFPARDYQFEKHAGLLYYFGIHFPGRTNYLLNSLGIWYFFSFILLLVVIFFGYTQLVILRQRRYTEIQRDFINTMTHEFKTPLSSLSMAADVVTDPEVVKEPHRLMQYGTIIRNQVNHLLKQVDVVLDTVGPGGAKMKLNLQKINLRDLINEVLDQLDHRIKDLDTEVVTSLDIENQGVEADQMHLMNVLINLIDNALKYSDGKPQINISLKEDQHHLILTVADRGIGVPAKYAKRVFDRFFRVPTGNVHNVKGFGLGLFYVKTVVKAHGWKIRMESEEGEGSAIIIRIPQ